MTPRQIEYKAVLERLNPTGFPIYNGDGTFSSIYRYAEHEWIMVKGRYVSNVHDLTLKNFIYSNYKVYNYEKTAKP